MNELDTIVLLHDIEKYGLKKGDIGAIVHIYPHDKAYEIEFISGIGETIALLTLASDEIRSLADKEILHARELQSA